MANSDIDWLALWRRLAQLTQEKKKETHIHRYEQHASEEIDRFDPLLEYVLQYIKPGNTILDIGAGGGRWSIPLARKAKSVIAVEPSPRMAAILENNMAAEHVNNIRLIPESWENAACEPVDFVVCAHAVYGSPDLAAFVRKMQVTARKKCFLALRIPAFDGVLGELSRAINGTFHDSPNAIIAYNALFNIGIYANIIVEEPTHRWNDATLEEAYARAKRHFRLNVSDFDGLIEEVLARRLTYSDGCFQWPDGMRSALLWWNVPSFGH